MIAVAGRLDGGAAVAIARRAAARGATAELIAAIPDGPDGDRRLLELAGAGVGHAAARRSGGLTLEPADLDLALRYLPDVRVVILAGDAATLAATAAEAAAWSGASLVIIVDGPDAGSSSAAVPSGSRAGEPALPPDAIVLAGPERDPDGAFAGVVATLAVRLDAGEEPATAWRHAARDLGLSGVSRAADRDPDPDPPTRPAGAGR